MRFSTHCGLFAFWFASWRVGGLGWVQLGGWKVNTEACRRRIARLGRKRQGEWAELVFMARGTGEGFLVSRPWGDSAPHDVGVDWKKLRWRVRVKSTLRPRRRENSFRVGLIGAGGEPYSAGMVDFCSGVFEVTFFRCACCGGGTIGSCGIFRSLPGVSGGGGRDTGRSGGCFGGGRSGGRTRWSMVRGLPG